MRVVRMEERDHRPGEHERELFEICSRTAARLRTADLWSPTRIALVARGSLARNDVEQLEDFSVPNVIRSPDAGIQRCNPVRHAQLVDPLLTVDRVSSSYD
jgi:hypothetical protein